MGKGLNVIAMFGLQCLYFAGKFFFKIFGYQLVPLTRDKVTANISEQGKKTLKNPEIKEPFDLLVKGLEKDHCLSPFGVLVLGNMIGNPLTARAEIVEFIKQHPEIEQVPIKKPIFLISLPRTGSTLMHNILAQDKRLLAPRLWEMQSLIPPPIPGSKECTESKKKCDQGLAFLHNFSGSGLDILHYTRSDSPEEASVLLKRNCIFGELAGSIPGLSEYTDWLLDPPLDVMVKVYEFLKLQLQIIGLNQDVANRQILLKYHCFYLHFEALLEVFPDAIFVNTHRDPVEFVPSSCSLVETYGNVFGFIGAKEKQILARRMLKICKIGAEKVMKAEQADEKNKNNSQFINVKYKDMLNKPREMIKNVYEQLGIRMNEETDAAMECYINQHPQHKHGIHKYTPEKYGFTKEELRSYFTEYSKTYL